MNELAKAAITRLGIDIDVTRPLGNYSVAIQQMMPSARGAGDFIGKSIDPGRTPLPAWTSMKPTCIRCDAKAEKPGDQHYLCHPFIDQVYRFLTASRCCATQAGGRLRTASLPHVELIARCWDAPSPPWTRCRTPKSRANTKEKRNACSRQKAWVATVRSTGGFSPSCE